MSLIPGLPNDFTCLQILAQLPWYTRPVMATTSRSLKEAIEGIHPHLTRKVVDLEGQVVILIDDGVLLEDPECTTSWRRLPKLPGASPDSNWATVTDGMVVVWTEINQFHARAVFKLDLSKPLVKWDPIDDCPILDDSITSVVFRGHLYYDPQKAGSEPVLRQYSFRTGQTLEHKMPEDVIKLWCAGDDRHLHAFVFATEMIMEFDTTTFQWKTTMFRALPLRPWPLFAQSRIPVGKLTTARSILFDPKARRWVRVNIDHPPTDNGSVVGILIPSFWGSVYALCNSDSFLWKCSIDFKRKKNTTWKLIYKLSEYGSRCQCANNLYRALDNVCWIDE